MGMISNFLSNIIRFFKRTDPSKPPYNNLFNTHVIHNIEIEINEADWQNLRENPLDKIKYRIAVTIDGEKMKHASISTKGNASLYKVAKMEDSDRYNFKINFERFIWRRTYHGLDALKLSSLYHDQCGMKDYMSYRIIEEAGGYTPLTSYAWVKINGKDFGLYLAVEELSRGWIERTQEYNGILYKPNPEWTDYGNKLPEQLIKEGQSRYDFLCLKKEYFGATDQGADLVYAGDEIEDYRGIFHEEVTKSSKKDKARLIKIIRDLNRRENLSTILDTDEVIAYFAGHNFVMNNDSYTGITLHNYLLYEENGKLSTVSWDYNEGFGKFAVHIHDELNMTDMVNWGIDTPLVDAEESQRPLWAWIVEDKKYRNAYHAVMAKLVDDYILSGKFEKEAAEVYGLIRPYLEKDPTFLYSMDVCENTYQLMKAFCLKRATSIRKQLDGTLSRETSLQKQEDRVDASDIREF